MNVGDLEMDENLRFYESVYLCLYLNWGPETAMGALELWAFMTLGLLQKPLMFTNYWCL